MARRPALLLVSLALGASALAFVALREGSEPADGRSEGNPTSTGEGRPQLEGVPHDSSRPEEGGDTPQPPSSLTRNTLKSLWENYPPGNPDEWVFLQSAITGKSSAPPWITALLREVNIFTDMPVPPYRAELAFGESDRAWLARVHASATEERARRASGIADNLAKTQVLDEVSLEYSKLIAAVAERRIGECERCTSLLRNSRPLGEMEPGSPERAWLESMIYQAENSNFWRFPELLTYEDRNLLRAADLQFLMDMNVRLLDMTREMSSAQREDPGTIERIRFEVAKLADILSRRRAR